VSETIFTDAAIQEVYRCSQGVPRLINLVCDLGLFAGFSDHHSTIDREEILQAETMLDIQIPEERLELEIDLAPIENPVNPVVKQESEMTHEFLQRVSLPPPLIPVTIGNTAVTAEPVEAEPVGQRLSMAEHADMLLERYGLQEAARAAAQRVAHVSGADNQKALRESRLHWASFWKRLALGLVLGGIVGVLLWKSVPFLENRWGGGAKKVGQRQDSTVADAAVTLPKAPWPVTSPDKLVAPLDKPVTQEHGSVTTPLIVPKYTPADPVATAVASPAVREVHVVTIQKGETLRSILLREYSRVDPEIVGMVLQANTHITKPDRLLVGQRLVLPPWPN
jgi:hypothetical protein